MTEYMAIVTPNSDIKVIYIPILLVSVFEVFVLVQKFRCKF